MTHTHTHRQRKREREREATALQKVRKAIPSFVRQDAERPPSRARSPRSECHAMPSGTPVGDLRLRGLGCARTAFPSPLSSRNSTSFSSAHRPHAVHVTVGMARLTKAGVQFRLLASHLRGFSPLPSLLSVPVRSMTHASAILHGP